MEWRVDASVPVHRSKITAGRHKAHNRLKLNKGLLVQVLLQLLVSDHLTGGRLPLSYRRAALTIPPKKHDLQFIKNWRPVSLLCSGYKLHSKVLLYFLALLHKLRADLTSRL